jgi:anthranilate/para-aminobenzoate synthase component II
VSLSPVHFVFQCTFHTSCKNHCTLWCYLQVVRYHSLVIEADSLPEDLVSIAWTASPKMLSFLDSDQPVNTPFWGSLDNISLTSPSDCTNHGEGPITRKNASISDFYKIVMGIKHSSSPHYGVQVYRLLLFVLLFNCYFSYN